MANTPMVSGEPPPLEILWAEQQRQQLMRSNAAAIAERPDEEIREWLTTERRDLVAAAADGWRRQALTYGANEAEVVDAGVVTEITRFLTLVGTDWSETQRQEFINQCCDEFEALPVTLLGEAIAAARKVVWTPKRFVSWVFEYVEKPLARLEMEGAVLARLERVARDDG